MEYEEIQSKLASMKEEITALQTQLDQMAQQQVPTTEAADTLEAVDTLEAADTPQVVMTENTGTTSESDGIGGLGTLLSAIGSSGGLELLAGLLGGKKIGALAPLVGAFLGSGGGEEAKLFDALGQMNPDMQQAVKKLQGMWPVIQVVAKQIKANQPQAQPVNAYPRQHGMQTRAPYIPPEPVFAPPIVRPMEPMQTQEPQDWGAWTINRWTRG
jgi:hypothetical protein